MVLGPDEASVSYAVMTSAQSRRRVGRTPFERHYLPYLSDNAWGDAIRALLKTPPVRRKYFFGAPGSYRIASHYIVAPARFETMPEGAVWIGVVAHEFGHAVDFHGRSVAQGGRSIWLAPAMQRDRSGFVSRIDLARRPVPAEPTAALRRFPAAARACRVGLLADCDAAERVARAWSSGQLEEAIAILIRLRRMRATTRQRPAPRHDPVLQSYAFAKIGAFIAAVYDLDRGSGPSRAYLRSFRGLPGASLTVGHVAEAFANAFLADVLEGTELLSFLARSAAPHTHAAYRAVLARIADGQCSPLQPS